MFKELTSYILPTIFQTLSAMTPMFRRSIMEALEKLHIEASTTHNPIDKVVITLLMTIMILPKTEITNKEK